MQKYLQFSDSAGQEHLVNLNHISLVNSASATQTDVRYFNTELNADVNISHGTDTTTDEFQEYFLEQMRKCLASDWKKPVLVCEPPVAIAVTTIA
tara:strand:- start:1424 stop:1708 length:285 start_codon:yes stop_codon:yes gene_type:complete